MPTARFQTLQDWLSWQETLHPSAIELKLERIQTVAVRLGLNRSNSQNTKVITVAGTNGKGSCVATLVGLLNHLGKRVGAYTSPHIERYNERVAINGQAVKDAALCEAFEAIDQARQDISLTYFEFGTLAAFYVFQKAQLDYWVLEVGLGGRLDATNVMDADLAVITPIALDHCEWLGDTREEIVLEKAGICRTGKPAVIADINVPKNLKPTLEAKGVPAVFIGQDYSVAALPSGESAFDFGAYGGFQCLARLPTPSMAAAVQALLVLGDLTPQHLNDANFVRAFSDIHLSGRLQTIEFKGQTIVLDVAHNPAAIDYAVKALQQKSAKNYKIVFAAMQDKAYQAMLASLEPICDAFYFCGLPGFPRAEAPERFAEIASGRCFSSVAEGFTAAVADASATETSVLVIGSFYTVAEATHFMANDGTTELLG